ncbi:tRNA pseudouridine(38-40) synthase TruA [Algivirga pacifica]|uniref:tRNA pseudouridine synthase A n=1 Tax=Algivirga pacifica TaxID=1162670 RepID=A0ABP9DD35_9BACT
MKTREEYFYLLKVQYLGLRYHGWAKQKNVKTVQGMIERSFENVLGHDRFKTLGASRTDGRVSANMSAFELFTFEPVEIEGTVEALNRLLPYDIKILSMEETDASFNIIQHAKVKEYLYLFASAQENHPYCSPIMVCMREEMDIALMQEGAKLFEGVHNFQKYCKKPSADTVFEREILLSEIVENDLFKANFFPERSYIYRVKGKGFLRNQVRLMVGTLMRLGLGEITLQDIEESLKGGDNQPIGFLAPPTGLQLYNMEFL